MVGVEIADPNHSNQKIIQILKKSSKDLIKIKMELWKRKNF
jgi:hypothetical protein